MACDQVWCKTKNKKGWISKCNKKSLKYWGGEKKTIFKTLMMNSHLKSWESQSVLNFWDKNVRVNLIEIKKIVNHEKVLKVWRLKVRSYSPFGIKNYD